MMSCEQVLLVHFQGNADMDSGRSSQYIYLYKYKILYTKISHLFKNYICLYLSATPENESDNDCVNLRQQLCGVTGQNTVNFSVK